MGKVADCTQRAKNILIRQLSANADDAPSDTQGGLPENVFLEWNDGGHFHEIPKRFAKAIIWWAKNA